jgi:hypothetical protein
VGCGRLTSPDVTLWEERAARNEALFREVNEQAQRLGRDWEQPGETPLFICECADDACTERIAIPAEIYARVRENPRQFLIRPGHEHAELERVVATTADYLIVEKTGTAGNVAERTTPPPSS